ncbi:MAG: hypothetical protein K2I03_09130 [Lachnospiraceae bacterium]|nr:hypothetical protein [Lachnospiraceae bacterium]MDE6252176.1 hypothetical protein [Lachnospiraceae bacterium]
MPNIFEIQSIGDLKQDMQFRRHLSRGALNVPAESTLPAMARKKISSIIRF